MAQLKDTSINGNLNVTGDIFHNGTDLDELFMPIDQVKIEKSSRWENPMTLTLTGGQVSGSVSFDGSQNVSLDASIVADGHSHSHNNLTNSISVIGNNTPNAKGLISEADWSLLLDNPIGKKFTSEENDYIELTSMPAGLPENVKYYQITTVDYYNNYYFIVIQASTKFAGSVPDGYIGSFIYLTKDLSNLGEPIATNCDIIWEVQHTSEGFYFQDKGRYKWYLLTFDRNLQEKFNGIDTKLISLLNVSSLTMESGCKWVINENYNKIILSVMGLDKNDSDSRVYRKALIAFDMDDLNNYTIIQNTTDYQFNLNPNIINNTIYLYKGLSLYKYSFKDNGLVDLGTVFSSIYSDQGIIPMPSNPNNVLVREGTYEFSYFLYDTINKKVITKINNIRVNSANQSIKNLNINPIHYCYYNNILYCFATFTNSSYLTYIIYTSDGINWYHLQNTINLKTDDDYLTNPGLQPILVESGIISFILGYNIDSNNRFYYYKSGDVNPTQMNLHHHDDRYYTIQEINTILTTLGSSDSSLTLTNYYTKADIDSKLKGYALSGHTHSNYVTTIVANNTYAKKTHNHIWNDNEILNKPKIVNSKTTDGMPYTLPEYLVSSPTSLTDTYPVNYSVFKTKNIDSSSISSSTDGLYYEYSGFTKCNIVFNGEYFITVNTQDKKIYYSDRLDQMMNATSLTLSYLPDKILYNHYIDKVIFIYKNNGNTYAYLLNGSSPDNWTLENRTLMIEGDAHPDSYEDPNCIDIFEKGITITTPKELLVYYINESVGYFYAIPSAIQSKVSLIKAKLNELEYNGKVVHIIATVTDIPGKRLKNTGYFNIYQRIFDNKETTFPASIATDSTNSVSNFDSRGTQIVVTDAGFLSNQYADSTNKLNMQRTPKWQYSVVNLLKYNFGDNNDATSPQYFHINIKSFFVSLCQPKSGDITKITNESAYIIKGNSYSSAQADIEYTGSSSSNNYTPENTQTDDYDYQNRLFVKNGYLYVLANAHKINKINLQTAIKDNTKDMTCEVISFYNYSEISGQQLLRCVNYFGVDGTDTIKALFYNACNDSSLETKVKTNMIAITFGNDFYGTNHHNHDSRYVTRNEYEVFEGNVDLSKYYTKTEAEAKMDEKDKISFDTQVKALPKMLNTSYDDQDVENYRLTSLDRMIAENDLSVLYKLNRKPNNTNKTISLRTVTNAASENKDLPVCGISSSVNMSDRDSYTLEPVYRRPNFEYNSEYDFYYIKSSPVSYPDLGMHFYSASSEDSCINIYRDSILTYRDNIIKEMYSNFGCSSFSDATDRIFYTDGKIKKNYLYLTMYIGSYTQDTTTNKYTWSSTGNKFFIFKTEILSIDKINGFILDSSYEWYGFDTTEITSFNTDTLLSTDNIVTSDRGSSYYLLGSGTNYLNANSIIGCSKYQFKVLLGDISTKENSKPFLIYNSTDKKDYLIAASGNGTVKYYSFSEANPIDYDSSTEIPYSSYFIYNLKLEKTEDIFVSDGEAVTFNYYTAFGEKSRSSTVPTSISNYNDDSWGILDLNDNIMTWVFIKEQDNPRILCTIINKTTLGTSLTIKITNNIKNVIALPLPAKRFKYSTSYGDVDIYDIKLFPKLVKDNKTRVIIAWLMEGRSLQSHEYYYGYSLYIYEHFVNNQYSPEPVNCFNFYGSDCKYNNILIGKDKILLGSDKYDNDFSYSTPNLTGYQYTEIGGLSHEQKTFDTLADNDKTGLMTSTQYNNLVSRNREAHILRGRDYIPFEPIIKVNDDLEFICENDEFSVYYSKTDKSNIFIVCNYLIDVNKQISFVTTGRNCNTCSIMFSNMDKMSWCSYKGNIYGIIEGSLYRLGNYGYRNSNKINSTTIDFSLISTEIDKLFTNTSDSDEYSEFGDAPTDIMHNYALYSTNDELFAIKTKVQNDSEYHSYITLKRIIIDKQISTEVILKNEDFLIENKYSIPQWGTPSSTKISGGSNFAIIKIEDIRLKVSKLKDDVSCQAALLLQVLPTSNVEIEDTTLVDSISALTTSYMYLYFTYDSKTKTARTLAAYDFINKVSSNKIVKFIGGDKYTGIKSKDTIYFQIGDNLYMPNKLFYSYISSLYITQCNQILETDSVKRGTKWYINGRGIQDVRRVSYSDYNKGDVITDVHYEYDKNNDIFVFYRVNNKMNEVIRMSQVTSSDYSFNRNTLRISESSAFSKYLRYKNKFYLVSDNWAYESKIGPNFNPVEYPKISGKNYKLDVNYVGVYHGLTAALFHNDGSGLSVYSNDAYSDTVNYNFRSTENMFYDKRRKILYQISTIVEDGKTYPKMIIQHMNGYSNSVRAYKIPILLSEFASNTNLVIKQIAEDVIFICNKLTETTNSNDGLTSTSGIYYSTKGIIFNLDVGLRKLIVADATGGFSLSTLIANTAKAIIEYNPDENYSIIIDHTDASRLGKTYFRKSGENNWSLMESTDYTNNKIYYVTDTDSSVFMPTTNMTGLSLAFDLKYIGNSNFLYVGYEQMTTNSMVYKICNLNGNADGLIADFKDSESTNRLPSAYYGYMFACENSKITIGYSVGTAICNSDQTSIYSDSRIPTVYDIAVINDEFYTIVSNIPYNYSDGLELDGYNTLVSIYKSKDGFNWERISDIPDVKVLLTCKNTVTNAPYRMYAKFIEVDGKPCIIVRIGLDNNDGVNSWKFFTIYINEYIS